MTRATDTRDRGQRFGLCRLHQREEVLCESHVVSKTLHKWFKRQGPPSSAVNVISVAEPSGEMTIAQDGIKAYMLCNEAEQLIGQSERHFKELAFDRFVKAPRQPIVYGPWLARFGISVIWRFLEYGREQFPGWTSVVEMGGDKTAERWRRFLLSKAPDPSPYDLHMIPIVGDGLEIQNYIGTVIETILVRADGDGLYACVTLAKLLLIGTIRDPYRNAWQRTRIEPSGGTWGGAGTEMSVPEMVQRYVECRASTNREALASADALRKRLRRGQSAR